MPSSPRFLEQTKAFKQDFKRECKGLYRQVLKQEFELIIRDLVNDTPLDEKYCDHPLSGNFKGFRLCHIRPNLVMMYLKIDDKIRIVRLVRLGDHQKVLKVE